MTVAVPRALYDSFTGTLEDRVTAFLVALQAHRQTIGVPAPVEDPVVEAIARGGGAFAIEEPPEPGTPAQPEPPQTPEPEPELTRLQLRLWLAVTKSIPLTRVEEEIGMLTEPERTVAQIKWAEATRYLRTDPLLAGIGAGLGLTPEDIDAGFIEAREMWP